MSTTVSTYLRYAHTDGYAVVCHVSGVKNDVILATAGDDGEVRLWSNIDDDDPNSHRLADSLTALCVDTSTSVKRLIVGTDYNGAAPFLMPDLRPDGVLTRFTAPITDLCVQAGWLAAASCDMHVRVVSTDGKNECCLPEFSAPVLCVLLSPVGGRHLVTACCDGKLTFWKLEKEAGSCHIVAQHAVFLRCNDVSTSETRLRCHWRSDGNIVAAPVDKHVQLYSSDRDWQPISRLQSQLITETLAACQFSVCGRYLAASSVRGHVLLWRIFKDGAGGPAISVYKHERGTAILTLSWHPDGSQLAFTDSCGQLGVSTGVDKLLAESGQPPVSIAVSSGSVDDESTQKADIAPMMDLDALESAIDDDDDDDILEAVMKQDRDYDSILPADIAAADDDDDDDDDENAISLRKIKAASGFGEYIATTSKDSALSSDKTDAEIDKTTAANHPSVLAAAVAAATRAVSRAIQRQQSFQPGGTPTHLERRFMVWNSVGAVVAHDDEASIDVEFHDSSVHHPLHIHNVHGHHLAALSDSVLVLAAFGSNDDEGASTPARVQCVRLSAWDEGKEWYQQLPDGEKPHCLCAGSDWLAVASTSSCGDWLLRVMSVSGVQLLVVALSDQPLCLSAWGCRLLLLAHSGHGNITAQLFQVVVDGGCRLQPLSPTRSSPVSIPSPNDGTVSVCWAGVCVDTGSPCVQLSSGAVFVLSGLHGCLWTPLSVTAGDNAHLFIVSVHEKRALLTGVLCRGARYPAVLPRPVLTRLTARLPFCELNTEQGRWESEAALLHHQLTAQPITVVGGHIDDDVEYEDTERRRALTVLLTKLFALACKSEQQQRAVDVAVQLTHDTDTLRALAGYANKQRAQPLVERLMELIERAEQRQNNGDSGVTLPDDESSQSSLPAPPPSSSQYSVDLFQSAEDYRTDDPPPSEVFDACQQRPGGTDIPLSLPNSVDSALLGTPRPLSTPNSRNPFRCAASADRPPPGVLRSRGIAATAVFDNIQTNQRQPPSVISGGAKRPLADTVLKPAKLKKARVKRQTSL